MDSILGRSRQWFFGCSDPLTNSCNRYFRVLGRGLDYNVYKDKEAMGEPDIGYDTPCTASCRGCTQLAISLPTEISDWRSSQVF